MVSWSTERQPSDFHQMRAYSGNELKSAIGFSQEIAQPDAANIRAEGEQKVECRVLLLAFQVRPIFRGARVSRGGGTICESHFHLLDCIDV